MLKIKDIRTSLRERRVHSSRSVVILLQYWNSFHLKLGRSQAHLALSCHQSVEGIGGVHLVVNSVPGTELSLKRLALHMQGIASPLRLPITVSMSRIGVSCEIMTCKAEDQI